ncbi:hypothetical protein ACFW04_014513 [Cataglyphis niger]
MLRKFSKLTSKHNTVFNSFDNIDNLRWLVNISLLGDSFGLPLQQSHKKDRISIILETVKNLEANHHHIQIFKHHKRELPRCYGLPKIYKTGFPLRHSIIVSSLSSPLYNISKYIHDILHNSNLQPKSHIKDGWSFAADMKDKLINDDEIIISFDVTALFTNIPKELVLRAIKKRWNDIASNTKFNLSQFLYAVEVILDSTSFSFNEKFYEQIFGSPMGSLLLDFTVSVYYRYVDDIFVIIPRAKVDEINVIFNSYHQRLKFIHEIESDSWKIITNWYRKPTCSNRYINFYSNHPFKYKINTIFNLVDHAILLSDDHRLFNCFPIHVINCYIHKRLNFLKYRVNSIPGNEKSSTDKPSYIALPFVESLNGLPISNRTEVVYKINCKNYSAYIGQTKKHLSIRIAQFNSDKIFRKHASAVKICDYCFCAISSFPAYHELNINVVAYIFHSFSKYYIIH